MFVLDSADKIRFAVAKNELEMLLGHPDIKGKNIPVLFYANKMDLEGAASPQEFVDMLKLEEITDRSWHIWYVPAQLLFLNIDSVPLMLSAAKESKKD